jgi:6,7-dimethyl-8-ribityllumazine synthase
MKTGIPILNGVLTVENKQQAVDRAGAKFDKGAEYANATIQLLNLLEKL